MPCWRSSRDALAQAIAGAEFALSLGGRPSGRSYTGSSFERRFYPVGGETEPAPLTAPFSYVVRYYRPAEDEAAFIKNYVETHPPTLGKLPGIRSVMCYFPQAIAAPGVLPAGTRSATRSRSTTSRRSMPRCNRVRRSCASTRVSAIHRAQHAFPMNRTGCWLTRRLKAVQQRGPKIRLLPAWRSCAAALGNFKLK